MTNQDKILAFLVQLPEPYRTQALNNYDPKWYNEQPYLNDPRHKDQYYIWDAADAIRWAFDIYTSPQDWHYWENLYNDIKSGAIHIDPLPPEYTPHFLSPDELIKPIPEVLDKYKEQLIEIRSKLTDIRKARLKMPVEMEYLEGSLTSVIVCIGYISREIAAEEKRARLAEMED